MYLIMNLTFITVWSNIVDSIHGCSIKFDDKLRKFQQLYIEHISSSIMNVCDFQSDVKLCSFFFLNQ